MSAKLCPACNGTGVQTDVNGVQWDDICPMCSGDGDMSERCCEQLIPDSSPSSLLRVCNQPAKYTHAAGYYFVCEACAREYFRANELTPLPQQMSLPMTEVR